MLVRAFFMSENDFNINQLPEELQEYIGVVLSIGEESNEATAEK